MNKRNYKCYKIRQKSNKVNIVTNKTEKVSIRKCKQTLFSQRDNTTENVQKHVFN